MKLNSIAKSKSFTPEFNDNKKLPPGEQINVKFSKFPTAIEAEGYKNFKQDAKGNFGVSYNDTYMIINCVGGISNLNDGKKDIKNAEDLIDSKCLALSQLIAEIRNYILDDGDILNSGEEKA